MCGLAACSSWNGWHDVASHRRLRCNSFGRLLYLSMLGNLSSCEDLSHMAKHFDIVLHGSKLGCSRLAMAPTLVA